MSHNRDRYLFLFGGSPPFPESIGRKFAKTSLKAHGKVAILFVVRDGWKEYMPKYTSVLEAHGVKQFTYIPLSSNPTSKILNELKTSTGIIICGGETERYREYIVHTLYGKYIQERYEQGVPVAGFSAGALITPRNCVISPVDNSLKKQLFLDGLGLLKDCLISVHFTKWNEEERLNFALKKTSASIGYGIDDEGYISFENERLIETESARFYQYTGG